MSFEINGEDKIEEEKKTKTISVTVKILFDIKSRPLCKQQTKTNETFIFPIICSTMRSQTFDIKYRF